MKYNLLAALPLFLPLLLGAQTTVRIAAHDSSEEARSGADVVCTGVHDELAIQEVLDGFSASPEDGYTILFHDGTYNIGSFYSDEDYLQPTAIRIGVMRALVFRGVNECAVRHEGVVFRVLPEAYEGLDPSAQVSVIACSTKNPQNYNHITLKNFRMIFPDISHKVIGINTYNAGAAILENLNLTCLGAGPGRMPAEGSVGVRGSAINPNGVGHHWTDVVCLGFYEGFQIGGEHLVGINLLGYRCYYGYTFGNYDIYNYARSHARYGVWEHPITLINCGEELCASLPLFNVCGASYRPNSKGYQVVDLISHTVEYRPKENPTLAPVLPARETVPGTWCGNISFCGNELAESWENSVSVPFWAEGSGHRFITRNSAHAPAGTMEERLGYTPMYMQQFYDTDLEKLLIYNGEDWVDTSGRKAAKSRDSKKRHGL